jgi:hypothetical protein
MGGFGARLEDEETPSMLASSSRPQGASIIMDDDLTYMNYSKLRDEDN